MVAGLAGPPPLGVKPFGSRLSRRRRAGQLALENSPKMTGIRRGAGLILETMSSAFTPAIGL